jgi:hypothetical protein
MLIHLLIGVIMTSRKLYRVSLKLTEVVGVDPCQVESVDDLNRDHPQIPFDFGTMPETASYEGLVRLVSLDDDVEASEAILPALMQFEEELPHNWGYLHLDLQKDSSLAEMLVKDKDVPVEKPVHLRLPDWELYPFQFENCEGEVRTSMLRVETSPLRDQKGRFVSRKKRK